MRNGHDKVTENEDLVPLTDACRLSGIISATRVTLTKHVFCVATTKGNTTNLTIDGDAMQLSTSKFDVQY